MTQANPTTAGLTEPPELTLPPQEAEALKAHLSRAAHVLEYGSGGSTVLAGDAVSGSVVSIESDPDWAAMMRRWFEENPPKVPVTVKHVDIGPTKSWGRPATDQKWRRWPNYASGAWDLPEVTSPDLVIVDGRFRVACVLAAMFRTRAPLTLLFDDYVNRPRYHRIEKFVRPVETFGRMARFEITPNAVPAEHLTEIIRDFSRPA